MIDRIIRWCATNRGIVVVAAVLVAMFGLH